MTERDTRTLEFEAEAIPHMAALYSFALRMLRDADEAADLVQETYLKAFRFFDSFERGTNCKAWLFRILKNSYINRFRKTSKEPRTVDFDDLEDHYETAQNMDSASPGTEDVLFQNVLADDVAKAIDTLPSEFRTVVILCDIEGFTYEEIADFVDCPVGTVRSRLHRARKILASKLQSYARDLGYDVGGDA